MVFSVLLQITILFVILYFMLRYYRKFKKYESKNNITKVLYTFPVNYKTNGYILKVSDKYYLCIEGCGIVPIEYNESLGINYGDVVFSKKLSEEFSRLSQKLNVKDKAVKKE